MLSTEGDWDGEHRHCLSELRIPPYFGKSSSSDPFGGRDTEIPGRESSCYAAVVITVGIRSPRNNGISTIEAKHTTLIRTPDKNQKHILEQKHIFEQTPN